LIAVFFEVHFYGQPPARKLNQGQSTEYNMHTDYCVLGTRPGTRKTSSKVYIFFFFHVVKSPLGLGRRNKISGCLDLQDMRIISKSSIHIRSRGFKRKGGCVHIITFRVTSRL
jgi:hypothetical protein